MRFGAVIATVTALAWGLPGAACEPPIDRIRQTSHLMGEMTIHQLDGKEIAKQEVLLQRTQDPLKKRFEEEIILREAGSSPEVHRLVLPVDPELGTFQITEQGGAITGHGTLFGAPWRWGEWQSIMDLPDGRQIIWNNVMDGPGMTAEGTLYNPQKQPQLLFKETLLHVNSEDFYRRRQEMLPDR